MEAVPLGVDDPEGIRRVQVGSREGPVVSEHVPVLRAATNHRTPAVDEDRAALGLSAGEVRAGGRLVTEKAVADDGDGDVRSGRARQAGTLGGEASDAIPGNQVGVDHGERRLAEHTGAGIVGDLVAQDRRNAPKTADSSPAVMFDAVVLEQDVRLEALNAPVAHSRIADDPIPSDHRVAATDFNAASVVARDEVALDQPARSLEKADARPEVAGDGAAGHRRRRVIVERDAGRLSGPEVLAARVLNDAAQREGRVRAPEVQGTAGGAAVAEGDAGEREAEHVGAIEQAPSVAVDHGGGGVGADQRDVAPALDGPLPGE